MPTQDQSSHEDVDAFRLDPDLPPGVTGEFGDATERLEGSAWERHGISRPRAETYPLEESDQPRFAAALEFLERQVEERPLPTLLLAAVAGWVAGKVLR